VGRGREQDMERGERERGREKKTCVYGYRTHQLIYTDVCVCGRSFPKMCVYGRECGWLVAVVYVQPQSCHNCVFANGYVYIQLCDIMPPFTYMAFLSKICLKSVTNFFHKRVV